MFCSFWVHHPFWRKTIIRNYRLCWCAHAPLPNGQSRCEGVKTLKCSLPLLAAARGLACVISRCRIYFNIDVAQVALCNVNALFKKPCLRLPPLLRQEGVFACWQRRKKSLEKGIYLDAALEVFRCRDRKWRGQFWAKACSKEKSDVTNDVTSDPAIMRCMCDIAFYRCEQSGVQEGERWEGGEQGHAFHKPSIAAIHAPTCGPSQRAAALLTTKMASSFLSFFSPLRRTGIPFTRCYQTITEAEHKHTCINTDRRLRCHTYPALLLSHKQRGIVSCTPLEWLRRKAPRGVSPWSKVA